MNWLTRLIPSIGSNRDSKLSKSKVPGGLWNNCPACDAILYQPELEKSLFVCPKCDHHLRIGARTRMSIFLMVELFRSLQPKLPPKIFLNLKILNHIAIALRRQSLEQEKKRQLSLVKANWMGLKS
jgi:acetyl-CoA carboxylase carboxyl transferase subunit beta